jgi:hypothetical protein
MLLHVFRLLGAPLLAWRADIARARPLDA